MTYFAQAIRLFRTFDCHMHASGEHKYPFKEGLHTATTHPSPSRLTFGTTKLTTGIAGRNFATADTVLPLSVTTSIIDAQE